MDAFTSLYIRKSLRHHTSSYIHIAVILIISQFIISIAGIYADSVTYGNKLKSERFARGSELWLRGAGEGDITHFVHIGGVEMTYEDGIIYIDVLKSYELDAVRGEIDRVIMAQGLKLHMHDYSQILANTAPQGEQTAFIVLRIVFSIVGTISIYLIYLAFIEGKKRDLGILISLGIKLKQLKKMLFAELMVIYTAAFILVTVTSNVLMYVLIPQVFKIDSETLVIAAIEYRFSVAGTVILLVLSLASLLIAYLNSVKRLGELTVIAAIREEEIANFKRSADIWNKTSAESFIAGANLVRSRKFFSVCSAISIPVIFVSIFILNVTNALNIPYNPLDYDFGIHADEWGAAENADAAYANIADLEMIEGIAKIEYRISHGSLFLPITEGNNRLGLQSPVWERYLADLRVLDKTYLAEHAADIIGDPSDLAQEGHVLLNKYLYGKTYEIGDTLELEFDGREIAVVVAGFVDIAEFAGQPLLNMYTTRANYESILEKPAVPRIIHVTIEEGADSQAIDAQIRAIFTDEIYDEIMYSYRELYRVNNIIQQRESEAKAAAAYNLLAVMFCASLIVCAVVLLWVFICFYISRRQNQIRILKNIGAARRVLVSITMREALAKGIINTSAGLVLGTVLSQLVYMIEGYNLLINRQFIAAYAVIIAVTLAAHFVPSYLTIYRMTSEKESA